ncbi:MAG: hypothetical protein K1X79_11490 [Oligoflexia bacterium]|nr:hypothetical protein [Oligoflexia bacterium]
MPGAKLSFRFAIHLLCALSVVSSGYFSICLAESQNEGLEAHKAPPAISDQRRELFVQALLSDTTLKVSAKELVQDKPDKALVDVWEGNEAEIDASLADILMKFVRVAPDGTQRSFDLSVRFVGENLYVRHSTPAAQIYAGGVRIGLKGKIPRKMLLQGFSTSGVVIAAPPMEDTGLRGTLICPLDFIREEGVIRSPFLVDTGFRVRSVQLRAAGHAQGRVLTGSQLGMARAYLQTSSRVPNEGAFFDVSYTKDPYASVSYLPDVETQVFNINEGENFLEGIEASLELQTAAGFKRRISIAESLSIEPFTRDERFTITFLNQPFVVATRNCVLLLQQRTERYAYSKEELKLPERIKRGMKN